MTALPAYLIVANAFTPTGGMERANHALALHVARRDGVVHLVGHEAAAELLEMENVHFHRVPRPLGADLPGMPLVDRVGRFWARRVAASDGRVVVNGGNCLWGDVNWVHYVHAAWGEGWKRRWFMRHERRAIRRARLIIANSRRTKSDLVNHLGIDERKIVTTCLGADPARFALPSTLARQTIRREMGWSGNEKVVLFVGAASDRRKGFDRVMEAWREMEGDWRLVTVGADGPPQRDNVEWLGFRADVERLMGAADLLVAPSRYESYGLGVHEALCMGTPAVASARAGVAEVYSPRLRELLVEDVENSRELAGRLKRWAADRDGFRTETMTLSDSLRQRSWDVVAGEIVEAIEQSRGADASMKIGMEQSRQERRGWGSRISDQAAAPSASGVGRMARHGEGLS